MLNYKEILLSKNIVLDNAYLDKYVNLIETNLDRKKQLYETQLHHIIPQPYYKHNKLSIDNSKDNLVNLLFVDHLKAHYYLYKCSADKASQKANEWALKMLIECNNIDIKMQEEEIQKCYKDCKASPNYYQRQRSKEANSHPKTEITKINMRHPKGPHKEGSKNLKGSIWIHKNNINKRINKEEFNHYLNLGYKKGKLNSKSIKEKYLNSLYVHKDNLCKKITLNELEDYIKKGWIKGRKSFKFTHTKSDKGRKKPEGFGEKISKTKLQKVKETPREFME